MNARIDKEKIDRLKARLTDALTLFAVRHSTPLNAALYRCRMSTHSSPTISHQSAISLESTEMSTLYVITRPRWWWTILTSPNRHEWVSHPPFFDKYKPCFTSCTEDSRGRCLSWRWARQRSKCNPSLRKQWRSHRRTSFQRSVPWTTWRHCSRFSHDVSKRHWQWGVYFISLPVL